MNNWNRQEDAYNTATNNNTYIVANTTTFTYAYWRENFEKIYTILEEGEQEEEGEVIITNKHEERDH